MKKRKNIHFTPETSNKYILLLDNNRDSEDYIENTSEYINNIKKKKINKNKIINNIVQKNKNNNKNINKNKNKNKINKKLKILRNFSSNFKEGILCLDSPNKSVFAKRLLSEIIPEHIVKNNKKYVYKQKYYESEKDLLILNSPKNNDSFISNQLLLNEKQSFKTNIKDKNINKRYSQNINPNFLKFLNFKRSLSSKNLHYENHPLIIEPNYNNHYLLGDNGRNSNIQDIIEEDNNKDTEETVDNISQNDKSKYKSLKINLKKVQFNTPQKLNFEKIHKIKEKENKSLNCKHKKNKIPKPMDREHPKLYLKKCDLKKHFCNEKFVSNFLTPINQFIKNDFQITSKEYENINKKIHNFNYLINNNDYTIYMNKKKKIKYKDFTPPKIPNISNIIEKKYFTIINELKNYKFKI